MAKKVSYKNCEFCSESVLATDLFCKHCNRDIGIDSSGTNARELSHLSASGRKKISKKSLVLLIVGSVVVIDIVYYSFPSIFQSTNQSSSGTTSADICSKLTYFMERDYKTASDFASSSISASTAKSQLSKLMKDVDNYRHSINDELGAVNWGELSDFQNLLVSYPNNLYLASDSVVSDLNMYAYWVEALNRDVDTKNQLCP
jgi:hypothetical protein